MTEYTSIEDQEFVAKLVKERAIHLTAIEGFKERLSEIKSETKERFGKTTTVNIDKLAASYLKGLQLKEKAQESLDLLEELNAEVEVLSKYINTGSNVYDDAEKYMEVL